MEKKKPLFLNNKLYMIYIIFNREILKLESKDGI